MKQAQGHSTCQLLVYFIPVARLAACSLWLNMAYGCHTTSVARSSWHLNVRDRWQLEASHMSTIPPQLHVAMVLPSGLNTAAPNDRLSPISLLCCAIRLAADSDDSCADFNSCNAHSVSSLLTHGTFYGIVERLHTRDSWCIHTQKHGVLLFVLLRSLGSLLQTIHHNALAAAHPACLQLL